MSDMRWRWRLFFEPRDLWVGCYWNRESHPVDHRRRVPGTHESLDVYLIVIPTLVLHLCYQWEAR